MSRPRTNGIGASRYPDTPEGRAMWAEYCREWRRKNKEHIRAYKREYNKEWRKKNGYHNEANSISRYPLKQKARVKLRYWVEMGVIKKLPCHECGNKNTEAHHPDHTKALEVVWLCKAHHQIAHGRSMDLPS